MFSRWGAFVYRFRKPIALVAIVVAILASTVAGKAASVLSAGGWLDPTSESTTVNDRLASEWKYIPVRRLTLYIEESLYRGTKWAVFEPNADPLWTSLRLSVNSFLSDLQRQGAFYSYFVQCDNKTTTADDIALGIVNVIVGIAPVKPAEFVIIQIQQTAGQTS